MKKLELKQIIREEIYKLNEALSHQNIEAFIKKNIKGKIKKTSTGLFFVLASEKYPKRHIEVQNKLKKVLIQAGAKKHQMGLYELKDGTFIWLQLKYSKISKKDYLSISISDVGGEWIRKKYKHLMNK